MDYFIFQQINNLAGQWASLDALGIFFAQYLAYLLVGLAILIFWGKRRTILQAFMAVVLARFGIVELIRLFWLRPRPFVENNVSLLLEHNGASFPSGHAAFFFALSFIVYQYNKKAGIGFFVASFFISIARVFVGIHWPSDILAGALVGIFSGWLAMRIWWAKR
ncbi:MAG: hypothetical protein A2896_00065 [Candidatus Nealsonbacteria bacterium RIFCSPLOWO2_01_FULL_43_32]|uniref:Phosphatidic acid phosphatase type 2/haloperoxidase domain-containing protein n=1 Tax=Candidatus Nealsonbacteria bacterium RIFCSPLOWO2_01_FULL_43_32 TaxID=1801672 RepID=A0A1G2EF53_9BACT|nr:MAG: hypothetical protein A2896_00065 [Candidatus Nealsonbacteria bacterium RIFCSPLOWO2_01_FULL_43_32]